MNIKEWYLSVYPEDELGLELNDDATFEGLFEVLDAYEDVYAYLGEGIDSVIRERVFQELADIAEVDYEYIYDQWLLAESAQEDTKELIEESAETPKWLLTGGYNNIAPFLMDTFKYDLSDWSEEEIQKLENKLSKILAKKKDAGVKRLLDHIFNHRKIQNKLRVNATFSEASDPEVTNLLDVLEGKLMSTQELQLAIIDIQSIASKEIRRHLLAVIKKLAEKFNKTPKEILIQFKDDQEKFSQLVNLMSNKLSEFYKGLVKKESRQRLTEGTINFTYSKEPLPTYAYILEVQDTEQEQADEEYWAAESYELAVNIVIDANHDIQDMTARLVDDLSDTYDYAHWLQDYVGSGPLSLSPGYYDGYTLIIEFDDFRIEDMPADIESSAKETIKSYAISKMQEVADELGLPRVKSGGWTGPIILRERAEEEMTLDYLDSGESETDHILSNLRKEDMATTKPFSESALFKPPKRWIITPAYYKDPDKNKTARANIDDALYGVYGFDVSDYNEEELIGLFKKMVWAVAYYNYSLSDTEEGIVRLHNFLLKLPVVRKYVREHKDELEAFANKIRAKGQMPRKKTAKWGIK